MNSRMAIDARYLNGLPGDESPFPVSGASQWSPTNGGARGATNVVRAEPDFVQNWRGVILFQLLATAQYGTCHRWSACQKCCSARGSVNRLAATLPRPKERP